MTFAKQWRKKHGITQKHAAHVLGVGLNTWKRLEKKEELPQHYVFAMKWLEHIWR